jgi:hypothetical protein
MAKANKKQTSKDVAKIASELLRDPKTPAKVKKVAASDLAQTKPDKKKK